MNNEANCIAFFQVKKKKKKKTEREREEKQTNRELVQAKGDQEICFTQ